MSIQANRKPHPALENRPVLREKIWKPCNEQDQHYMGCIVGQEGSGKSSTALRIGELVDPDFGVDKVFFHPKAFIEALEDGVEKGDLFVFDEAGVELGNRSWYDSEQIEFNKLLQTIRNENAAVIFTLPVFDQLDVQAQTRVKGLLTLHDKPYRDRGLVLGRYYEIDVDRVGHGRDDVYRKKPVVKVGDFKKTISQLGFQKPTEELMESYEEKKREFQAELYERVGDAFADDGEKAAEEMSPQEVVDDVLNNEILDQITSWHGGHNREYIDKDLIMLEYPELGHQEASQVKKLLKRHDEVEIDD